MILWYPHFRKPPQGENQIYSNYQLVSFVELKDAESKGQQLIRYRHTLPNCTTLDTERVVLAETFELA